MFNWLRRMVKQAFLGGIADAVTEIRGMENPPVDLLEYRDLNTDVEDEEEEEAPTTGNNGRAKRGQRARV